MIRVSVMYPNDPEQTFDQKYYIEKHIPLVKKSLENKGLKRVEIDRGISAADPNVPAPFVMIAHLFFNSVEEVHEGFKAVGRDVQGDITNYTTIKPQYQISETIS